MKGETRGLQKIKSLKDLTLLNRFLFAEAMDDPVNMRNLLEIILGREIVLKELPQTEKEQRSSPLHKYVKLDVWAVDEEENVYDTEPHQGEREPLPKRSRLYQGMIDSKLLEAGEVDYTRLNNVYIIVITPYDVFGLGKYRYTFRMSCQEEPGLDLQDGAERIFLNTRGTNKDEVSPELVELLNYMENTNTAAVAENGKVREIQKRVEAIKSSEEVGVKYMQAWEEKVLERQAGRQEGMEEKLKIMTEKKWRKGKTPEQAAEDLEEDLEVIQKIYKELEQERQGEKA
ncbi:MAG TPA: Rpn family recombination-promoting nuclease/putative transposase [Candidatus Blautia merdavium]|uniref:Rpn family recombination-promoting nuclease/putative transposase n=1 Tax=Candidatus Blautia merdavium TaxID=2838494 RepID=A0A9D2PPW4_9FIRM|nr:Rpn family recombination-promoting nuclease/putative transposase [Candidatus Blautia merdavium]